MLVDQLRQNSLVNQKEANPAYTTLVRECWNASRRGERFYVLSNECSLHLCPQTYVDSFLHDIQEAKKYFEEEGLTVSFTYEQDDNSFAFYFKISWEDIVC